MKKKQKSFKFERKKNWHDNNFFQVAVVLVVICLVLFPVFMFFRTNLIGFVVWQAGNQSSFDEGTYANVFYNTTGGFLQLNTTETSGTYTSVVFDAESNSTWNNMSWTETLATQVRLIVVDGQADIWKSVDSGANWTLVKDDYNNGESNNAIYMLSDSNDYLYTVEDDDDVWQSTDVGVTWTKVNDDYNGEGEHIKAGAVDSNDNIFIIEGDEDVWKSIDSGTGWTKVNDSDFNGGNGDAKGMVSILTVLYVVDNSADIWKSVDSGANWTLVKDDYNNGESNNAIYMLSDSNDYLYTVEDDDDVWQSTDVGVTWTKVNDDYNGEGEHIKAGAVDSNDNIFIIEGDEDVWKSIDSGTGWTKVNDSDFNGGNGDAKGMTALLVGTDLTFQARSCELANCSDESFSGSYTNPSGENLSVSANRYFQYKASFSSDASDMTPKLYNVSIDYTVLSSEPSDSEAPAITLISPTNNTGDNDGDITLSYNITDDSDIANCSLIINDVINQTDSNVTKNMTQEFMLNNLTARIYMWGVNCTDSFGNEGSSETRQFSAILTTEFSGDTTDLSVTDVSNIANLIIENISAGKIVFQESVDLSSGANIDGNVSISFNSIEISTDTLPALNKSANVYVYSLDYIDPTPVLNSVECPSSICTEISYENGTFVFSVTQFSVYSTKETPINDDSSDSTSQPSVGGNCYNEWTCTGWSECTSENIQKRTCSYIGTCNVHEDKPKETQDCIYISSEPEKNIIKLEPVFDMLLEIPTIYKDISVEDDLVVIMKLTDIKLSGKSDIIINFKIIDEDNNILLERSETIAVENKANLLREFELPENTKDGLYQLEATLFYGNNYELKVVGSDTFNVKRVVVVNYNLIIIVLFSVIGTIIYIAFKQRKIKYIFMKGIKNSIIDKKIRRKLEIKPKKS